jgi:2-methylcitrate dehydratase PrpD
MLTWADGEGEVASKTSAARGGKVQGRMVMRFTAELAMRAARLRASALPSSGVDVAKAALVDTLAVALAATSERVVSAVHGLVREDGGAPAARVWGTSIRVPAAHAAFANGTAAHALDFDDVCWAMNAHPSAVLWPAVLAVAESRGASGERALLGYVAGFEAEAALGSVLGREHYAAGFHPTATLGAVGAAVGAGVVVGLDEASLRRAIGIACSEAAGSRMAFGTDVKPLHAGLAARAGVTAALLAERGITAREDSIETELGLGSLYRGHVPEQFPEGVALLDPGIEQKPYPSCRFTHRIIDATVAIRERAGGAFPRSIACVVDPFAKQIVIHPRPSTGLEAKFSMPYCAAVAYLDGAPTAASFSDDRARRTDVQSLLRLVTEADGTADAETVTVTLGDGRSLSETVRDARGSPRRPLSLSELADKFRDCAGPLLGDRLGALLASCGSVEKIADVRELTALLGPAN